MTLVIVIVIVCCYVLIATESMTGTSKAAVAIFAGTLGWVLYICHGSDYVASMHGNEVLSLLTSGAGASDTIKYYIAKNIFLKYVGEASEIALFLIATLSIVDILDTNGCLDFISQLMKTRNRDRLLWTTAIVTFIISANLDTLTTMVMMIAIMHKILPSRRQRMVFGSVILLSANCGGILTVIGDPTSLYLWNNSNVSATTYSLTLALPVLVAWLPAVWWIGRSLPERIDTEWITMPYRGDDTRLNAWQRLAMLFVGIGGLWFIPTFHDITKLSPFIGALCVLGVLWIVNELFNRKLMQTEQSLNRRGQRMLQYGTLQMVFFIIGFMLLLGVAKETGIVRQLSEAMGTAIQNHLTLGITVAAISTFMDNFATSTTFFFMHDVQDMNAPYWMVVAYATMTGGNILTIGSISGLVLMKAERMHTGWYFKNVGIKTLATGMLGLAVLLIQLHINQIG